MSHLRLVALTPDQVDPTRHHGLDEPWDRRDRDDPAAAAVILGLMAVVIGFDAARAACTGVLRRGQRLLASRYRGDEDGAWRPTRGDLFDRDHPDAPEQPDQEDR